MSIDWFTLGAQALNFVILVWLMKHFLYRPILTAIAAREKKVAAEVADAGAKKAEAEKAEADLTKKNKDFDSQRDELLEKAKEAAKAEHLRLLDEARKEAIDLREKSKKSLQNEQNALSSEIRKRAQDKIFEIVRKALTELGGVTLEERMTEVFIRRLNEMSEDLRSSLKGVVKAAPSPLLIRSAFNLPQPQRLALESAVKEFFGSAVTFQYETSPNTIAGIELDINGRRIAWNIADYLTSLKKTLVDLQKATSKAETPNPEVK